MRSFASDNNSSVHSRIMEALMKTNNGHALGYGDDPWPPELLQVRRLQSKTAATYSPTVTQYHRRDKA